MARVWGVGKPLYRCNKCHREVFATKDGYMPRHRPPGKRKLCDGSGSSIRFHKKVTNPR